MTPTRTFLAPLLRRETLLALALTTIFLMLGIIGRDPWKADEPYSVGIVLNMLRGGDWLIPHVGADPFLEKPPLMFWSAALTARLFGGILSTVDAARLAVVGWMVLTVLAIAWAARSMYGRQRGWLAVMLALGAIGIWQHSHKLIPDISQLAGATLALAAVVRFSAGGASARLAGLVAGTGVGVAFLSKGLLIPGVFALLAVLFPLCRRDFRTRSWLAMIGWAAAAALPWLVIWPALLYHASRALFIEWLWDNNIDRFLGMHHHGEAHANRALSLVSLIGLAFPASVLAGLALAQRYRRRRAQPWPAPTVAVLIYALTLVGCLEISASFREVYFLPAYPALALLGAELEWSPRPAAWFRNAAMGLFGVLGVLLIATWALLLAGKGEQLPSFVGKWLPLDYVLPFRPVWLIVAAAVAGVCLLAVSWRRQLGPAGVWFAGATLVWGLCNTLLLPWLDVAKSYRYAFNALARALPADTRCVTAIGFGESERAMFQHFTGRIAYAQHQVPEPDCGVTVVMAGGTNGAPAALEHRGRLLWAGSRLGERNRRFFAYQSRDAKVSRLQ